MKPKKVAIVAEWMTSRGGGEKVVLELLKIFPEADLFTTVYRASAFPELKGKKVTTSFLQKIPILRNHHQALLPLLPRAIESLDLEKYDLVISSSSSIGKGVIKSPEAIHLCYCHTPMRYVWQPNVDRRLIRIPFGRFIISALKKWDLKTNKGVDIFVCNSNFTKERIKKFYNLDARVIYPPAILKSEINTQNETGRGNFYFAISRLVHYKRFDLAIEAFNKLGKNLTIAGAGPEEKWLRRIAGPTISFIGAPSDEIKKKLFQTCKAVIFPAEEDFGIVPIEAQAYGAPVIAYGKGGNNETVINGRTGILFGKQEIKSIIESIEKLERIHFTTLDIKRNASRFTNEKFKQNLLKLIDKI